MTTTQFIELSVTVNNSPIYLFWSDPRDQTFHWKSVLLFCMTEKAHN